jgi:diadenosine tetraphosphate (Ap4A) HIT family hydrolase
MVKINQNQENKNKKEDCIFCKIASGEFDSAKIWEDENFLAFLDIMPNTKGMTLVIPKKHFDSYAFDMPDKDYSNLLLAVKKVTGILEKGLDVKRVAMVMEGLGVNHAHIKLYPIYGLDEKFKEIWAPEKKFFENYEGYISTQTGPKMEISNLKVIAKEILDNSK